jgi:hypothetical protein
MPKPLHANPSQQLLVSRADAAKMLGNVSTATIVRLQKAGRLKPIRLNPRKATAMVFYATADVSAVALGGLAGAGK